MSELYNLIESLCKGHGTNITAMCKAAEVSRAPLTELKMGRTKTLSSATLTKIATYFGVSVDYLIDGEETLTPVSLSQHERIIDEIFSKFCVGK